jgi:GNAT superfamily N-acetyltransferase
MEIRPITSAEARTVHLPVLRPGLPPEAAILDHDDDPAWRLRGMATYPEMQGRAGGSQLAAEGLRVARADEVQVMWCNACVSARGFYEKLGFTTCGDEFVLPVAGPHYVMIKDLRAPS